VYLICKRQSAIANNAVLKDIMIHITNRKNVELIKYTN
jgi:hypothetical protein